MFSNTQEHFIAVFTEEFIRELRFIVDVSRGRAQERSNFFDQMIEKISLGSSVLNILMSFFPVASAAARVAADVAVCVVRGMEYLYEYNMNSNVHVVINEAEQPEILLRLMIEGAARETARRYEFFLNHMCHPDAVVLFATVGIVRILQYLSDNEGGTFTVENLLKGLIEGKSGAGQQGGRFQNNHLRTTLQNIPFVSAETIYGRSAIWDSTDGIMPRKQNIQFSSLNQVMVMSK